MLNAQPCAQRCEPGAMHSAAWLCLEAFISGFVGTAVTIRRGPCVCMTRGLPCWHPQAWKIDLRWMQEESAFWKSLKMLEMPCSCYSVPSPASPGFLRGPEVHTPNRRPASLRNLQRPTGLVLAWPCCRCSALRPGAAPSCWGPVPQSVGRQPGPGPVMRVSRLGMVSSL